MKSSQKCLLLLWVTMCLLGAQLIVAAIQGTRAAWALVIFVGTCVLLSFIAYAIAKAGE